MPFCQDGQNNSSQQDGIFVNAENDRMIFTNFYVGDLDLAAKTDTMFVT